MLHNVFLIRVPRGFFALDFDHGPALLGASCDLRYDAAARQFACDAYGYRWQLDGTPVPPERESDPAPGEALWVPVRIATDGHLLIPLDLNDRRHPILHDLRIPGVPGSPRPG
jgi:hypothetical protein